MIEATPEYLLNVLDKETALKVWRSLRGVRIYFPKCKSEHDEIRELFKNMTSDKPESVKTLMYVFDKSESQIRNIIRQQGGLFEED